MKHYLDFEKPIVELQRKLEELKKHPETHSLGISFEEEAAQIEKKIEETRRMIFSNLTPWQRVQLARHPKRPYTLDYLQMTFTDFSELHGDRLYSDDRAIVGGLRIAGRFACSAGQDSRLYGWRDAAATPLSGYRRSAIGGASVLFWDVGEDNCVVPRLKHSGQRRLAVCRQ